MTLKLTPLNLVSSLLLVSLGYSILFPESKDWQILSWPAFLIILVICFITDILFRRMVKQLKRIWIIEMLFIIFVALTILIIRGWKV